jgi:hypothetical protein
LSVLGTSLSRDPKKSSIQSAPAIVYSDAGSGTSGFGWFQKMLVNYSMMTRINSKSTSDCHHHHHGGTTAAAAGGGSGLESLLQSLRKQTILELRIGWHDCDHLRGPRSTTLLMKAIRNNKSLTHVMIGWRRHHPNYTIRLLTALAASKARLLYLDLSLDDAIPASVLSHLLASQQHLVEIHLRAVRVYTTTTTTTTNLDNNNHHDGKQQPPIMSQQQQQPQHQYSQQTYRSIVKDCIMSQYRALPHWKILSLIDCNLTNADLIHLADFLHIRGGLAELRLRSNRQVSGAGLLHILQAPVMKKLDVSLCDLQPDDGILMANALQRRPWPLDQFILAGNYRLGKGAIALVNEPCVSKIRSLDLSYSVHTDSILSAILTQLGQSLHSNHGAVLQRIAIHGAWNETTAVESLEGLLWQQRKSGTHGGNNGGGGRKGNLRSLQLNNPHSPIYLSVAQVQSLECALRDNYELEDLGLDYPTTTTAPNKSDVAESTSTTSAKDAVNNLQFWLRLNSAGRRIVQHPPPPLLQERNDNNDSSGRPHHYNHAGKNNNANGHEEWLEVVEKAGQDSLTVLYWIIRNSAERFGQR